VIGNAGSFFKNPVVNITLYQTLKLKYPEIPSYKVNDEEVKIPAGWLIEKTGYKGKIYGNIGVHKDQALVIVNFGGGQGVDIKNLSTEIQKTVFDIFSINIHPEVNIW
jgi:UDP-N-acetylmuramate dehydrogenase